MPFQQNFSSIKLVGAPTNAVLKFFNSTKQQIFRLVQIESTCRREKLDFVLGRAENIMGKGENAFPIKFSKGLFLRVVKSPNFAVKT